MNKNSKKTKYVFPLILGVAAVMALGASVQGASAASAIGNRLNKYYPSHLTMQETIEAAGDLNEELADEGMVLLKNDGSFPLKRGSWVTVFGVHNSGLNHGWTGKAELPDAITTVPESLEAVGFHVNPTIKAYYDIHGVAGHGGAMASGYYDDEVVKFNGQEVNSYSSYNDAAIIVLARAGGEGSDISTVEKKEPVGDYDFEHKALYTDEKGVTYHHDLMLTKSEYELIDHVKANGFKKICIVINSSNAMELGGLKDDPMINGMIWMGCPGETGCAALGRIIVGDVNPSGRLVDEFPRDFTADPTWCNFGNQAQVGNVNHAFTKDGDVYYVNDAVLGKKDDATYTYTDYEEDIYLGYRYYETYYEDLFETDPAAAEKWYEEHVAFAFGEGLSYSDFDFEIQGVYTDAAQKKALGATVDAALFASSVGHEAQVKKLYIPVKVTNYGKYAGKETVQIYVKAPFTQGQIQKSVHDIVGFGKSDILDPGESEIVTVEINVQDFASWDARDLNDSGEKGDYELDEGMYTIRATSSSHVNLSVDLAERLEYDETSFKLLGTAHLKLDDFTGNELHNLFTTDNGKYHDIGYDGKDVYNSERTADMMLDGEDAMTKLERGRFDETFPEPVKGRTVTKEVQKTGPDGQPVIDEQTGAPVTEVKTVNINGLTFTDEVYARWEATRTPRKDWHPEKQVDTSSDGIRVYQELTDDPTDPWYISEEEFNEIAANWTQAASTEGREIKIKYADLHGKAWDDPIYEEFLNQLTWDELISLFCESRASTPAIDSVGKAKSVDEDGPNNFKNLFEWVDEPTIAATFNTELAEREGKIVGDMAILSNRAGWYGPGMDMHHTAFSGRNNEYYSQDGLQGGYIAAAVVRGAQSKGLNAMIKHLAFNDQDTNRGGQSNMVWTSEQNIRQYEIKMFQMAIQEGGAGAGMSGYGRICGQVNQSNYRLLHGLLQDEWGWKGFMITDGFLGMRWCTTIDIMIRCGYQIQYKTEGPGYDWVSGKWDPTLRGGKGDVIVPKSYVGTEADWYDPQTGKPVSVQVAEWKESYHQYYYSRETAKSVIYSTVNSNAYENGFSELALTGGSLANGTVGVKYEANVGVDPFVLGDDSFATYTVTGLPDGLSVDSSGKISGTPKEEGDFRIEVTALIDGYVQKSAVYTLTIESAFYWGAGSDDVATWTVGEEYMAQIASDVFTTKDNKYDSVEYTLNRNSVLPSGVTLSLDGKLEGTPTESGIFPITVDIKATKKGSGGGFGPMMAINPKMGGNWGGGSKDEVTNVSFSFVLIVTGEEIPVVDPMEELEARIDALQAEIEVLDDALEALATVQGLSAEQIEAILAKIAELEAQIANLPQGGHTQEEVDELNALITSLRAEIEALKKAAGEEASSSPATSDQPTSSEAKKGGCGGSVAIASIGASLAFAAIAALIIKKKKEN